MGAPPHLLVVEDNPADCRLLEHAFEEAEFTTRLSLVGDGIEALRWLHDRPDDPPDLVVLDLNLPKMDGRELLAELRGDPRTSEIPVIVMSSSHYDRDLEVCRRYAVRGYVIKPGGFSEFVAAAKRIAQLCDECLRATN